MLLTRFESMADKVQVTLGLLAENSQEKCVCFESKVSHPVFFASGVSRRRFVISAHFRETHLTLLIKITLCEIQKD